MTTNNSVEIERADAFERLPDIDSNSFHAAVIDYPWEMDTENGSDRFGYDRGNDDDDFYTRPGDAGLVDVLDEVARIVVDGGWVFIFADDDRAVRFREYVLELPGLTRRRDVYWDSDTMGMGYYHRVQAYPIVTATVGSTERYLQSRPNIYNAYQHGPSAEYHTQKPVGLMEQILSPPVLEDDERVLVPFAGTFPSGVVAEQRGCGALGFDIDERAIEIATERLDQSNLSQFSNG